MNFRHLNQNEDARRKFIKDLRSNGYAVIRNFASDDELSLMKNFSDRVESGLINGHLLKGLAINNKDLNYNQLRDSAESLVDVRGLQESWDVGMIDIFNPHVSATVYYKNLMSLFQRLRSESLVSLMTAINPKIQPRNTNLYIHRNVINPRMPHIDSIRNYFKGFLAISDHTDHGCGPLGIIPKSHKKKITNYMMCFFNRRFLKKVGSQVTDATFYSRNRLIAQNLNPGDLLLCNVSLVHGAIPAEKNGYRCTLVQCFDR